MKRTIKYLSLILVAVLLSSIMTFHVIAESGLRYILSEDFEQAERPSTLQYHDGSGNIHISPIGAGRALYLQNDSDGSYTLVSKSFSAITDGFLTCEVNFLQPDVKSDNNIILELLGSGNPVFSIVTENGNITVKSADGNGKLLVSDYYTDKWYSIKVVTDLTKQTCNFYVNESLVLENIPFLKSVTAVDVVSAYARFSPGFYLDDFKVSNLTYFSSLTLAGESRAAIPMVGETKARFHAALLTESGAMAMGERLTWLIEGATTGVRLVSSEDTMSADLYVSPEATIGGMVTVTVKNYGGSLQDSIGVQLEETAPSRVVIFGEPRISAYQGTETEYSYSAKVYDQLDNEISGEKFTWILNNNSGATVGIDPKTGVLKVSGIMPDDDENVVVTARLNSDDSVVGTKKVLVQRYDIYHNDSQRLQAAIHSIDNVTKAASNPDGRNPLMGFYISPYSNTYGYWNLEGPKAPTACSNLTEQFQMMRAMVGISALTGDDSYRQRVMDIYQWHFDHAISKNGLVYWGNHQTMDLETGQWAEYFEKYATSQPYVEVKDRDLFMEPFFELDPEKAAKICKDHWSAIINDWGYMNFNRHALINNNQQPNYSGWDNIDAFIELSPEDPWVKSKDLCFTSSAAALLVMSDYLYKHTHDTKALLWAKRLIYRYINTRNTTTNMFGTLFITSTGADGTYSLEEAFGKNWWVTEAGRAAAKSNIYGDRAYTQFGQTLIDLGLVTPEQAQAEIKEGAFLFGNSTICDNIFIDTMHLAQTMKEANLVEEGDQLMRDYFSGVAAYIRYGYDFEQNNFHRLFTNGIVMDDIVWTRPGYWGSAGKTFGSEKPQDFHADNFIKGYLMTEGVSGLEEDRELVWECARNICDKTYHLGDIGNPNKGIEPKLNMGTNTTNPMAIRILLNLYEATGNSAYLDGARVVGNNIISTVYRNGYFIPNSQLQYLNTDGEYAYVLLKLEAYIRGESELVPDSRYQSHLECDAVWRDERNKLWTWSSTDMKTKTYPNVNVIGVRVDKNNLNLTVGESEQVQVTIRPDDATSKAIFWDIKDKDIVSITEDNTFIAKKAGETVVYVVARGTMNMVSEPVYVTVQEKGEK